MMPPESLAEKLLRTAFYFFLAVWLFRTAVDWLIEVKLPLTIIGLLIAAICFVYRIIKQKSGTRF